MLNKCPSAILGTVSTFTALANRKSKSTIVALYNKNIILCPTKRHSNQQNKACNTRELIHSQFTTEQQPLQTLIPKLKTISTLTPIHCVSKMLCLCLAIFLTNMNWFWQFMAEMLLSKKAIKRCFTFTPHLTSASASAWWNRKPGNCIFLLEHCTMFNLLRQQTQNTWRLLSGHG